MVLQDAFERVQAYLDETVRASHAKNPRTKDVEIVIYSLKETDDEWIFGYQTRAWIEDKDINAALSGNKPIAVPKSGEPLYVKRPVRNTKNRRPYL